MSDNTAAMVVPLLSWPVHLGETQRRSAEAAIKDLGAWLDFCRDHPDVVITVCASEDVFPLLLTASEMRDQLRALAAEGRVQFGTWPVSFDSSRPRRETMLSALTRARAIIGGLLGAQVDPTTALVAGAHAGSESFLAASGAMVVVDVRAQTTTAPLCEVVTAEGARLWRCYVSAAATAAEVGIKVAEVDARTPPSDALEAAAGSQLEPRYAGVDGAGEQIMRAAERLGTAPPVIGGIHEAEPAANPGLAAAAAIAENALIDAERLAALAAVSGAVARSDLALDHGWRQALHGMCIAAIPEPARSLHYDALAACQEAAEIGTRVADQAATALARRIDATGGRAMGDTRAILVVNPLGYTRTDLAEVRLDWNVAAGLAITDHRGRWVHYELVRSGQYDDGGHWADVCFVAEAVPALGWRMYFARPAPSRPRQPRLRETAQAVIQNGFLRIAASLAAGGVTSITDKTGHREILRGGVGGRLVGSENAETYPPSGMAVQTGPLVSRVVLAGDHVELGRWRQTFSLWAGVPRIDVEITFDRDTDARPMKMLWHLGGPGQVPIWGTDGGAWAGALDQARPLRNWLDLGHAALFRRGRAGRAIGPCAVIAPTDLQRPARDLVAALVSAGVPARSALTGEVPDLGHGTSYLLLGGPHENDQTGMALERAGEDARDRFLRAMERGGSATAIFSNRARQSMVAVAARDRDRLSDLVASWASGLGKGEIDLPRDTVVVEELPTAEPDGVAIIGDGSLVAQVDMEGEVAIELNAGRTARFALLPHRGDWRSARLCPMGDGLAHPLRAVAVAPSSGTLPAISSPVEIRGDVVVTGLRLTSGGAAALRPATPAPSNSVIVGLLEPRGREEEVKIVGPWPLVSAWRCNRLGERQSEMPLPRGKEPALRLGTNESTTIELDLDSPSPPASGESASVADDLDPTPVRYWEWGLGAAPVSSVPVAACLHGQPKIGETRRFALTVVNNQLDAEARGAVLVSAPEGWRLTPTQVPYRLPPGGHHIYEVAIIIPPDEPPGTITAEVEWRGRRFADSLVIGDWQPLECSIERRDQQLVVGISNPNPREVSGVVDIVTTVAQWLRRVGGSYGGCAITPRRCPFAVAANGDTEVRFEWGDDAQETIPVIAKVMYHRRADYIALGDYPTQ